MDIQPESENAGCDKKRDRGLVRVVLTPEAKEVYDYLRERAPVSKTERIIFDAVRQKIKLLRSNAHCGKKVGRGRLFDYYLEKYNARNLLKVKLPLFWRMLYTLPRREDEIDIIAFVLDIMDHKEYDRKRR